MPRKVDVLLWGWILTYNSVNKVLENVEAYKLPIHSTQGYVYASFSLISSITSFIKAQTIYPSSQLHPKEASL